MTYQQVPIVRLQPTEQYLCRASLNYLSHHPKEAAEPIDIYVDKDGILIMEGHNRTFLRHTQGIPTVPAIVHDAATISPEFGLEYLLIPWREICRKIGVFTIKDLANRIVPTREDVKRLSQE